MKKLFKFLSFLIIILLLALAALVFTFDPNDYKPIIAEQVKNNTGRDLSIAGDISYSIYPWIGLKVEDVSLANAEGFSDNPFLRMSRLDVKVKLLPLLRQELEVDKLRLHGLFASLEVNVDGRNNWEDLAKGEEKQGEAPAEPAREQTRPEEGTPALAALAINGIELLNATVEWHDAQNNVQSTLSDFNLSTGAIRFDQPVEIRFSTAVANSAPKLDATIELGTALTFNEAFSRFTADNLNLAIKADAPEFAREKIDLQLRSDMEADLETQQAKVSGFTASVFGATLKADLAIAGMTSEPVVQGKLATEQINLKTLAPRLGIELPPTADASRLTNIKLVSALNIKTSPAVQLWLDDIKVGLDDSTMMGYVHVNDTAKPAVEYKLHMTAINADSYLPPAPEGEEAAPLPAAGPAEETDPEIALPMEMLRKLELAGELAMDEVMITGLPVTEILIKTTAKDGVVKVPMTMKSLDGSIDIDAMVDARPQQPAYAYRMNANRLKAGPVVDPILAGLKGDDSIKLEGMLKLAADINTNGSLLSALKKNATGFVEFDMDKTLLTGVDLNYLVRNAVADYLDEKSLAVPAKWRGTYQPESKTAFDIAHARITLADGKASNKDMRLEGKRLKVKGEGVIDIMASTLQYRTVVDIDPPSTQTTAEKLLDQPLAVNISGPFAAPEVSIDKSALKSALSAMLKAEAKEKLQKEIEVEKEKLREKVKAEEEKQTQKVKDKLKDKLKGLF